MFRLGKMLDSGGIKGPPHTPNPAKCGIIFHPESDAGLSIGRRPCTGRSQGTSVSD